MADSCPSFHVAGVLVQALPRRAAAVRARIARVDGATVHAGDAGGRLVVTLESDDAARIAERIAALQVMEGVLSAVLVSEHSEPLAAANEELPNECSPPHPA